MTTLPPTTLPSTALTPNTLASTPISTTAASWKNQLQEFCHKHHWPLPQYTTSIDGPAHEPTFTTTLVVDGLPYRGASASTKSQAEQNSAQVACCVLTNTSIIPTLVHVDVIPSRSPPPIPHTDEAASAQEDGHEDVYPDHSGPDHSGPVTGGSASVLILVDMDSMAATWNHSYSRHTTAISDHRVVVWACVSNFYDTRAQDNTSCNMVYQPVPTWNKDGCSVGMIMLATAEALTGQWSHILVVTPDQSASTLVECLNANFLQLSRPLQAYHATSGQQVHSLLATIHRC